MYQAGLSIERIASFCGVTRQSMHKSLQRGVKFRSQLRYEKRSIYIQEQGRVIVRKTVLSTQSARASSLATSMRILRQESGFPRGNSLITGGFPCQPFSSPGSEEARQMTVILAGDVARYCGGKTRLGACRKRCWNHQHGTRHCAI